MTLGQNLTVETLREKRFLTSGEIATLLTLYKSGMTFRDMAVVCRCSTATIGKHVREAGLPRRLVDHPPREGEGWCSTCKGYRPINQFSPSSPRRCRGHQKPPPDPVKKAAYYREYKKANPEVYRRGELKRYGLTLEDYERVFKAQNGLCAICHRPETRRTKAGKIAPLAVEHNHKTGGVRELVCSRCNLALGMVGEDIEVAKSLVKYLEKWTEP